MEPTAEPILANNPIQKFDWKLIVIILLTVLSTGLIFVALFLFSQTKKLEQDMLSVQAKQKVVLTPTPTPQPEQMTQTYAGDSFTFAYPQDVYAVSNSSHNKTEVDFYLDEYHAKKAENCISANSGTMEDPCGFGWLVFFVDFYNDPKNKDSAVNWLFDNQNMIKAGQLVDSHGRHWLEEGNIPWTGSRMNITNTYFITTISGKEIVVSIAKPYYSTARINLDFDNQLLSSFRLQQ